MLNLNVYFVDFDRLILGISQLESRLLKQADFECRFANFQRSVLYFQPYSKWKGK